MFVCTKFPDFRSDLFKKLCIFINYQELKPKSHESISLLNTLVNPQNVENMNLTNTFI